MSNPLVNTEKVDAIIKVRRGPEVDRGSKNYDSGELIFSTDKKRLFIGDSIDNGATGTKGGVVVGNKNWITDNLEKLKGILPLDTVYRTDTSSFHLFLGADYLKPENYVLINNTETFTGTIDPITGEYIDGGTTGGGTTGGGTTGGGTTGGGITGGTIKIPLATSSSLGGVIIRDGLTVSNGYLRVDVDDSSIKIDPITKKLYAVAGSGIGGGGGGTGIGGGGGTGGVASPNVPGAVTVPLDGGIKIINGSISLNIDNNTIKLSATPNGSILYVDGSLVEIPPATSSSLGVIKVGNGLSASNTGDLNLKIASVSQIGGVKIGSGLNIDSNDGELSVDETIYDSIPIGTIQWFALTGAPSGYLLCDGRAIGRSDYLLLFDSISTTYGAGDGINTFNIPNLLSDGHSSLIPCIKTFKTVNNIVINTGLNYLPKPSFSVDKDILQYDQTNNLWQSTPLPVASSTNLGCVKTGTGIDNVNGVISVTPVPIASGITTGKVKIGNNINVTPDGVISVASPFTLSSATSSTLGGVKIGNNINVTSDGTVSVADPYVLPQATETTLGGIKLGPAFDIDPTTGVITQKETLVEVFVKPAPEQGFIKFLAKQRPSNYSAAAVTSTNRLIVWGKADGSNTLGGKLAAAFSTGTNLPPSNYIRVPFYSNWNSTSGPIGTEFLDENPDITIQDVYWNSRVGLALLSDGSVWVAGYNDGNIGLGAAPTVAAVKPTCGFIKLPTFGPGATIAKQIYCTNDNGDNKCLFGVLDVNDSLWVWGNTADAVFGNGPATGNPIATIYNVPTRLESLTVIKQGTDTNTKNFTDNIKDWSFVSSETTGTSLMIITKDNELYISGDNERKQRGNGNILTKMNFFNHAQTSAGTFITNADKLMRSMYAGAYTLGYINTAGRVFMCGNNTSGQIGDNTIVAKNYFTEASLPNNVTAIELYASGYGTPVIYALCLRTADNVKVLYSWGKNTANYGVCGVNSNAETINTPNPCQYQNSNGNIVPLVNVEKVFVSDQTSEKGAVCVVDSSGYAYTAGYSNYNDPPLYNNTDAQYFKRVYIKNVKEVIMGGSVTNHTYNMFLLNNGTLYGQGDVANLLFGNGVDLVKHPVRIL